MIRLLKIKASALQFAIFVSVMVALLLGSFLTMSHTHQFFKIQSNLFVSLVDDVNNGMEESLKKETIIDDSLAVNYDHSTLTLSKTYWGGFALLKAEATSKSKNFQKIALTGAHFSKPKTAVFIGDDNLPLVVVGNAQIQGAAFLSQKGIKAGSMGGAYYNGTQLVYGPILSNAGGLPKIEAAWRKYLLNSLKSPFDAIVNTSRSVEIKNSFFDPKQAIYSPEKMDVYESYLGNIILRSDTHIRISKQSQLTDVVVIAPKITIDSGFEGSVHLIASENITINEHVSLTYPSSVVVLGTRHVDEQPLHIGDKPIVISNNAGVQGIVVYLFDEKIKETEGSSTSHIYIEKQAFVEGSIYCEGNLELNGTVEGAVYTQRFIANKDGSRYINHIKDGKILGEKGNDFFAALPLDQTDKEIAKWLY